MIPVKSFTFLKNASSAMTGIETNNLYKGNFFITCIGYNSQGNIVSWVPADQ